MPTKEELLSKFSNFLDENLKEDTTPKEVNSYKDIDNGIRLMESIDAILTKESNNDHLASFVSQYKNALNDGCREECLYETFIQGLGQFGYLRAVDTELSALKDRISLAKQNIDLTKILEIMENTTSYYIVPLIESDVVSYMQDKSPIKRSLLVHHLNTFQHDPYVRQILNCINLDNDVRGLVVSESIETGAYTEKIYSPIQYIRENECVFNANGTFYTKKGNHIAKLNKEGISALNEQFVALCHLVNDPRVEIYDEHINFYHKNNVVKITEGLASINGAEPETSTSLRNLNEMYLKYDNYDNELFIISTLLVENFNKIAEIPFAKHIALNENEDMSIDLFRVKNNIFITAHNNVLKQHTFYRNINPIQCSNIINEHLNINAGALFEDLMPNQDKIKKELSETKEAYEERLSSLKEKKEELESVMDEADDKASIEAALKDLDADIKSTEDEYKDWQEKADKILNAPEEEIEDEFAKYKGDDEESKGDAEDILSIEKEDETPLDSEDDMQEPISSEEPAPAEPMASEEITFAEEAPADNDKFKIVQVDFARNLKTGEKSNTGNVIVVVPMVDESGNLVSETQTVQFYIDNEGKVVLNNAGMTAEMYNAILTAIESDPRKEEINTNSYGATPEGEFNNPMEGSARKIESPEEDVVGEELPTEDIEVNISADDDIPNDFFASAPKKEGISRWVPESEEAMHESMNIVEIAGQFSPVNESAKKFFSNKSGILREGYDNVLNSALEVPEPEDSEDPDIEIDSAEFEENPDTRTPLEKIREAALSYIEENDETEVSDIDVEETNFHNFDFFNVKINGNPWSFFEYNGNVYSLQNDAFLDALDACDSDEEFGAFLTDNEEVESCPVDAELDDLLFLLSDIISVETGEKYKFDSDAYTGAEDLEDDDVNEGIKVRLKKEKKESKKDGDLVSFSDEDTIEASDAEEGSEEEQDSEEKVEDHKEDSAEDKEDDEAKNESELPKIRLTKVNESATSLKLTPEPNDSVEFKGKRGTIQAVHPDGTLTLMVEGMTVDCSPREVKIITNRVDTMDVPVKFDPKTQAALYEQYVNCGIFQGGIRVTAADCMVNYAEWERKKDFQNVAVINEGNRILVPKKNVKIFEDVNDFANLDEYIEGVHMNGDQAVANVLLNAVDYANATAGNTPIRVLINIDTDPKLVQLPKDSLRTLAV